MSEKKKFNLNKPDNKEREKYSTKKWIVFLFIVVLIALMTLMEFITWF